MAWRGGRNFRPRRRPGHRPLEHVSRGFTIVLMNLDLVHMRRVVINVIANALRPVVERAGRRLVITRSGRGDISLEFGLDGQGTGPCSGLVFGNMDGNIMLGAHADLRICGEDQRIEHEHASTPREVEFARFVGNTCVHELGHMIAGLEDLEGVQNAGNFMHTGRLPRSRRTRSSVRNHWAGMKSLSRTQTASLVRSIRGSRFFVDEIFTRITEETRRP
jgi:hypothetical protein